MTQKNVVLQLLERLQPLSQWTGEVREKLAEEATLVRMQAGQLICREGDQDRFCVWLIKGSVETISGGQVVRRIDAGTEIAFSPLAEHQPRTLSVRTLSDVGLLRIPRERMAALGGGNGHSGDGISLNELDEDDDSADDWMTMLLRSPLYSSLPVTNIQRIMSAMESMVMSRGDVVVHQGDIGDYFYFLSKGQARVIRTAREGEPPVLLAELGAGVSFGEEALVAGVPRNATVSMITDGRVMRLRKAEFVDLILEPTLSRVSWVEAEGQIQAGARWLDVRFPEEFAEDGLTDAVNVPLGMLRMRMSKLERDLAYIVYCNDGKRSAAGAFLMAGAGFNVKLLDGGITTPDGIDTLDGGESPPEVPDTSPFGNADEAPKLALSLSPAPAEPPAAPAPQPEPEPALAAAQPVAVPDNTVEITRQLREKLTDAVSRYEQAEIRTSETETELRATREALKEERTRARDMAREMQHLRQTLTDIQRQAHDTLMRERSTYERELTQAVENLEQALLEKEMVLEVERAKNQEEVARLRRLLEASGRTA